MGKRSLNIKNLVPRKNAPYKQGYYKIVNPEKYVGDKSKVIFRSSWEKKFATYCDNSQNITAWSSEPFAIPYMNPIDNEIKPYNVDFYIRMIKGDSYKEYIVEVKPSKQLLRPTPLTGKITEKRITAYNNQLKTYMINMAKFKAAEIYAKSRGWEFIVVTEKWLY